MTAVEPTKPGDLAPPNMQAQSALGSDQLTPQATRTLTMLGQALADQRLAGLNVRIEGHTDSLGGAALNEALSLRRANAVLDFISSRYGVDRARLAPVGLGETQPLVPTGEGVAEPLNRRVMVVSTGSWNASLRGPGPVPGLLCAYSGDSDPICLSNSSVQPFGTAGTLRHCPASVP